MCLNPTTPERKHNPHSVPLIRSGRWTAKRRFITATGSSTKTIRQPTDPGLTTASNSRPATTVRQPGPVTPDHKSAHPSQFSAAISHPEASLHEPAAVDRWIKTNNSSAVPSVILYTRPVRVFLQQHLHKRVVCCRISAF